MLNLIEHLPRNSFFAEALADDEDVADQMADREAEEFHFRYSEWTPEGELLGAVYETLQVIRNVLVVSNRGKASPISRAPRPVGALQGVRERRRFEKHHKLVSILLPDR